MKKTSEEWLKDYKRVMILDPDGWDRTNWKYSWEQEEITKEEFERRLITSTIMTSIKE